MFSKINTKITEARDEEGFTLIELLVVILIIGILAAIAIPVFLNQQKAAVKGGIKSDVHNTTLNVALSLAEQSSSTGFVTYKAGDATPTLTAGQAAVKTVNTKDDVLTITNNPADGASPSTGTGNGAWNDYQVVGSNPSLPNYCFVFSSLSGKYTEYNDCTVATGSGTDTGSTTTPSPTASTPATVTVVADDFETSINGWNTGSASSTVALSTTANTFHGGKQSLKFVTTNSTLATQEVYKNYTFVSGKSYKLTGWVYANSATNVIYPVVDRKLITTQAVTTTTKSQYYQVTYTFTYSGTAATPSFGFAVSGNAAQTNNPAYLDDVTLEQTN